MLENLENKTSRIEVIDVLRGFTLLGIALVHFPEQYYAGMIPEKYHAVNSIADNIVQGFVGLLISGKFFMIFSFLFGLSFFLQLNKSDGSAQFLLRFTWRLIVLFLIGFVHHLHYRGDILTIYAMLGVGLLICYRLPDKILLIVALALVFDLPAMVTRAIDVINPAIEQTSFMNQDQKKLETYYETVKSGTYASILKANLHEFKGKYEFQVFSGRIYVTMGLFLLGLYAGRKSIFENVGFFRKLIRYSLWSMLGCILFAVSVFGGLELAGIKTPQPLQWLVGGTVMDVFNAALASIYVGLVVTLFQKDKWKSRLMNFYEVGRMGLTIYLMQALFGIFVFFSIGFGLLGDIGAAMSAVIGLVVFFFQIIFSKWWLKRFQYGPVEWLWRSLTYLKIQPLRKE